MNLTLMENDLAPMLQTGSNHLPRHKASWASTATYTSRGCARRGIFWGSILPAALPM